MQRVGPPARIIPGACYNTPQRCGDFVPRCFISVTQGFQPGACSLAAAPCELSFLFVGKAGFSFLLSFKLLFTVGDLRGSGRLPALLRARLCLHHPKTTPCRVCEEPREGFSQKHSVRMSQQDSARLSSAGLLHARFQLDPGSPDGAELSTSPVALCGPAEGEPFMRG